ncbi:extracellular solute-binding protein [Streptomyces sp. NBC_00053]|uniref:extracellular solute-binding protein n=1 Tax=unclassified Streptomyces TaxID=2593676 RepID=UPI0022543E73|nr:MULTISPECIES: extracellular solute-binding protein [unclassified Streptomyces]MCX4397977.1 extracellular solute-binding protein [Streptomyces sp. NBC_01767]MCX5099325.1 extracellular solute-binding protein [Streptomyces sp. NBC_00439]MCX5499188.1 extracellular solute-binding protein [Streptomyces sp. NBC_00052]MCX5552277.1 extracellular solute-binding protein [Streptomyces sp. NBC_00051]WSC31490.1 extracellular solute-binding protein [Streptomyces sp. NBC_01768]
MTLRLPRRSGILGALLLLTVVGCSSGEGGAPGGGSGGDLTVWLTVDARESWPEMVASANQRFAKQHPGVKVDVQYQQWTTKNQKLDAVLAGRNVPDVVEMGNSETTNYIVNDAFAPLDPKTFERSGQWLPALADACRHDNRTYCVPYYAGARVGVYRTDYFKGAGITRAPRTYPELISGLDRLKAKYGTEDHGFSALYMPGRYWSAAMAFVKDAGGEMAVEKDGRWQGALSSPKSVAGLTAWKKLLDDYYVGDRAKDNGDQPAVVGQGKVGVFYGNTWEAQAAADARSGGDPRLKGKFATFALPGPSGKLLPPFLGGSTLAVPAKSRNQELAADWIRVFTDGESQRKLIAANTLPNNTVQLADVAAGGINGPAAQAAARGWVTPLAPGWTSAEKSNVLPEMLERIATGKASVRDAAREADRRIDAVINER